MGWNKSPEQPFHLDLSIFSASRGARSMDGSRKPQRGSRKRKAVFQAVIRPGQCCPAGWGWPGPSAQTASAMPAESTVSRLALDTESTPRHPRDTTLFREHQSVPRIPLQDLSISSGIVLPNGLRAQPGEPPQPAAPRAGYKLLPERVLGAASPPSSGRLSVYTAGLSGSQLQAHLVLTSS